MTMTFDLQKYSKDLGKKNKGKGSDITESIKPKLKQRVRDGMERELRLEDIINLKIDFDEECEFNNEALEEIKSNIHLLIEPEDKKCIFIQGNIAQVMQDPKAK